RGFLGRRKEAQRDLPACRAGTAPGDPGRDRLGPGHRCAAPRRRRRQHAALARPRLRGDHPLPAPARLHQARRGARAGGWPHRRIRRSGTGAAAGGTRLRVDRRPPGTGGRRVTSPLLESLASGFSGDASRRALLDAALQDGLPGARSERWKYTPLRALERRSFGQNGSAPALDPGLLAEVPSPRLVFVNGHFDAALSRLGELPDGVELAAGEPGEPALPADTTGDAPIAPGDSVFARLNAALALTGVRLRVESGAKAERPVHLVFVGAAGEADALAWHLHHRIEVGPGATLRVVEHHIAAGEHRHLDTSTVVITVAQGALLEHARVQRLADGATSFARTDATLQADARYHRVDV